MRGILLAIVVILVVVVVTLKAFGRPVPILDYPIGPMGAPLIGPQIQIHPPGYDVNLP